jgi:hypothetical protein
MRALRKLNTAVVALEEMLIALAIGFLAVLAFGEVAAFISGRISAPEIAIYRRVGKWPLVYAQWLTAALITGLPAGLLCAFLLSRRHLVYALVPAVFVIVPSLYKGFDFHTAMWGLMAAVVIYGALMLGLLIKKRLRVTGLSLSPCDATHRCLSRVCSDVALFVCVIGNISIWNDVLTGNHRAEKFTPGFYVFVVFTLILAIFWRYRSRTASHRGLVAPDARGEFRGIGGWLILVVIGIVASTIQNSYVVYATFWPLVEDDTWAELTTDGGSAYDPMWAPLLVFEAAGNAIMIALGVVTLVFLLKESKHTPAVAIIWLGLTFGFFGVDYLIAGLIPTVAAQLDASSLREVVRTAISAAIWIPYFLVSKRVKTTLVK